MKPTLIATLALALAACSGSTTNHFDSTGGSGGVSGGVNGASTATTGASTTGGTTTGTSTGTTTGGTATGTSTTGSTTSGSSGSGGYIGGVMNAALAFSPVRTVTYSYQPATSSQGGFLLVRAFQDQLTCQDLTNAAKEAGGYFSISIRTASGDVSASTYNVRPDGGSLGVQVAEGTIDASGQLSTNYSTGPSGQVTLAEAPGGPALDGTFNIDGANEFSSTVFTGSFTAYPCP